MTLYLLDIDTIAWRCRSFCCKYGLISYFNIIAVNLIQNWSFHYYIGLCGRIRGCCTHEVEYSLIFFLGNRKNDYPNIERGLFYKSCHYFVCLFLYSPCLELFCTRNHCFVVCFIYHSPPSLHHYPLIITPNTLCVWNNLSFIYYQSRSWLSKR